MIDHVLGRPSPRFRKYQVFVVVLLWSTYLYKGNKHGPPKLRQLSSYFSKRITPWQTIVLTTLYIYIAKNFSNLIGLQAPEPLANLYSRSYFRATWITTALDAGFWTAMPVRPKWLKDMLGIVFTVYYLVCAEQADEKVRKVRATLTLEHLRISWNKAIENPYLRVITSVMRPRFMRWKPRQIRIPRPKESSYAPGFIDAWLYFDGPLSALKKQTKFLLDIPGGGFVAMTPRMHDDKLMAWAGKTGLPILSLNYKKAPEYPYPYALNECFDVYHTLIATRGRCIGLSGEIMPKIVISGDSAGGNLAVGMVLMILQSGTTDQRKWRGESALPVPEGLVLIYPALDVNIGNWMTDEQMALIKERKMRKTNKNILRRKSADYHHLTQPNTPHRSDDEMEDEDQLEFAPPPSRKRDRTDERLAAVATELAKVSSLTPTPKPSTDESKPATAYRTRLAMSSMISYFNDRVLTPEMMRAMIILYIGPHSRPDFSTDFLLSPVLTPESLLARFPKTYLMTGERDPLVDDTVIFAGRLRHAHMNEFWDRKEMGLEKSKREFRAEDVVEVVLVPGISHGFLNFVGIFPPGWKYVNQCADWIETLFEQADKKELEKQRRAYFGTPSIVTDATQNLSESPKPLAAAATNGHRRSEDSAIDDTLLDAPRQRHHRRMRTGSSDYDDGPLEMLRMSKPSNGSPPKNSTSTIQDQPVSAHPLQANNKNLTPQTNGKITPSSDHHHHQSRTAEKQSPIVHAKNTIARRRRKSLVSLASEDDLLGRRMKGLTNGLVDAVEVPPTP